jgi:hypothetical protein
MLIGAAAHRTLAQNDKAKEKGKADDLKVEWNNKDVLTGAPAPPSGKRRNFKTTGDAKQFLAQLGPQLTEQILNNARNLGADTLEAGVAKLEALMSSDDDVVGPCWRCCSETLS